MENKTTPIIPGKAGKLFHFPLVLNITKPKALSVNKLKEKKGVLGSFKYISLQAYPYQRLCPECSFAIFLRGLYTTTESNFRMFQRENCNKYLLLKPSRWQNLAKRDSGQSPYQKYQNPSINKISPTSWKLKQP